MTDIFGEAFHDPTFSKQIILGSICRLVKLSRLVSLMTVLVVVVLVIVVVIIVPLRTAVVVEGIVVPRVFVEIVFAVPLVAKASFKLEFIFLLFPNPSVQFSMPFLPLLECLGFENEIVVSAMQLAVRIVALAV
jgi:hypothetical protein